MAAEQLGGKCMTQQNPMGQPALTGRIHAGPADLLNEEILMPQFLYELQNLLPYYIFIEQAMLTEYVRLGLLSNEAVEEIAWLLSKINQQALQPDAVENMSDICFAIERYVEQRMTYQAPAWHADRSRNDVQATAQVMFAREQVLLVLAELFQFTDQVHQLAEATLDMPMPGYTHYQSAQIITPGFYLSAMSEQMAKTIKRLLALYEDLNECPLGSGSMAGLELSWDRNRLAALLGFRQPGRNALVGVASKEWALTIAAELSNCSVQLSRFATDLITWSSSEYRFIDLPDYLAGISSAMPQKKNFPLLERIRGRSSHISAYYLDLMLGQRNTPFTNLVETAKEGGTNFVVMMKSMRSLLRLFILVIANLTFKEERTRELCKREFFGGFSLANLLTLTKGIPYRKAQVIAGHYIVHMLEDGRSPEQVSPQVLEALCQAQGYPVQMKSEEMKQVFAVEYSLTSKKTSGSTSPLETSKVLSSQREELHSLYQTFQGNKQENDEVQQKVQRIAFGREAE